MTVDFSQEDINKLNNLLGDTPFRYAQGLFIFFQAKFNQAAKQEEEAKQSETKKVEDGN